MTLLRLLILFEIEKQIMDHFCQIYMMLQVHPFLYKFSYDIVMELKRGSIKYKAKSKNINIKRYIHATI